MAESQDLIDFNVIEQQKENIQALPSGRSAKALAQLYSPPLLGAQPSPGLLSEAQVKARTDFEKELATIDEADDPLDVYDRYVKWTLDAFPSAQATPQSQLLPLLERATKAFQSDKHYKNDPRYLKIWLHYIRLFSDAPREAFVFLARHNIGESLALYYEEFAAWLENQGRWNQAEEIYKMGIEKEATPAARLTRKFSDFEQRLAARPQDAAEPSSPALPSVRPALAAKLDPFASASPSQPQQGSGSKKSKSSKMQIFADGDAPSRPGSGSSGTGWDSFGSLSSRKKENSHEAKPMAGQKLKVGKTNGGMEKLAIFKDQSSRTSMPKHLSDHTSTSSHEQQCVLNEKTGRLECVFVNLEAVYPVAGNLAVEYCFEELRAKHRGWLSKNWKKDEASRPKKTSRSETFDIHLDNAPAVERSSRSKENAAEAPPKSESKDKGFKIFEDVPEHEAKHSKSHGRENGLVEKFTKTMALNDDQDENTPPSKQEIDAAKKARREERANRTRKIKVPEVKYIKNETQTIKLNMDSPQKPKLKRKKSIGPAEPTMTINTKEAMEEIYGIFSAPLPSQDEQQDEEEESESESDAETDYTTGDESTATGKLSAPASEYGDETRNELLKSTRTDDDDRTDVSAWSDFTSSKHVPQAEDTDSAQTTTQDAYQEEQHNHHDEDLITPVEDENPRTRYVPIPDEDYEPPAVHYQVLPNHRLPFMTPIAEQTESSLGVATARTNKDYFGGTKTPSRKTGMPEDMEDEEEDEQPPSSPFEDVIADMAEDKRRVLQPIRTKSTKGAITLGQGTAKAQTEKKDECPAADAIQKGPIVKDLQCNPMDPFVRQTILDQMRPSLSSFEGYYEVLDISSGRSSEIKKYVRTLSKASRNSMNVDKTAQTLSVPPQVDLPGAQGTYTIKRELGAGTFAPVYLVENSAIAALDEEEADEEFPPARVGKLVHRKALEAIKMEEPASTWEFYILRQSHRRLGVSRPAESIVRAHEMHLFRDECFLVEEYRDQGTLLDLVNTARLETGSGSGMDEILAMFFSIELLRTVEAMHAKNLIHGDLKGDNVLVRFDDPGMETDWSPTYFPSGAHGWSSKGVCLIDFGRGIDMKQFLPNVAFIADWKTSEADCAEMRELRPWTYQIDYHGLAGIIHSMLFGKYMETVADKTHSLSQGQTKTYRVRESFKRYWQVEIWQEAFQLLLNPLAHLEQEEGHKMPVLRGMRQCRERMEGWLEENCERGVGLKGMIGRMEAAIRERRKKGVKLSQSQ
ncbi:Checkpoint serine/threonine-protein kinase bub1 [Fulvia fulva]|uniref:Checkpoint serine/threonine-protein kinase bub1 n=1 Tax=Passalora fulva TaxID=5499 RepID=A0A9Q8PG75_PASFU|nr:Checkpoint serine/threonine-protein kinase bub1 [Fulvia fulva]KAK4613491.1 Checkpoint serine/threonine-protein kinase bub1 [Fulvia fulva]KAK4614973.1 Checkpoint serine/threonine-protein kinase bub1 [Fulvia fulva]UJO21844.1 Checkpoint serine/threonine-protein kinase bub1 [Fulvia fulva]WPV20010.1 Checkpoint serine/threonine-protein kinase bub1 [Fulvia fulva]WPV35134.1 Checkpoint serine/threonine-protein kinase bub1 [Fulvia fulva]